MKLFFLSVNLQSRSKNEIHKTVVGCVTADTRLTQEEKKTKN